MFSEVLDSLDWQLIDSCLTTTNPDKVVKILNKEHLSFEDFLVLLSPAAENLLPIIAQKAQILTKRYFGKIIHFYIPLYLSNFCQNKCLYCGYNNTAAVPRITLSQQQIEQELIFLAKKGFTNILLLTGEDRQQAGIDYLEMAVRLAKKYFKLVTLEVYPISQEHYSRLIKAGAYGLTIYQETYDRQVYDRVHLAGPKKVYQWRLDTPDRALKAGMRKFGLGVLLGLTDWRKDTAILGYHLQYLTKKYWQTEFTVSFPRIRNQGVGFQNILEVTDKNIVQMLLAFRLFQPSLGIIVSTREAADFRDRLIEIGVTQLSAESKTNPGGYSGDQSLSQFVTADQRNLAQVVSMLVQKGYDPVMKDWHEVFSYQ